MSGRHEQPFASDHNPHRTSGSVPTRDEIADRPRGAPTEEFDRVLTGMDEANLRLRRLMSRIVDGDDVPTQPDDCPDVRPRVTLASMVNSGPNMIESRTQETNAMINEIEMMLFGGS